MRKLILSIIRIREYLIKSNQSGKNTVKCHTYIRKTRAWLDAYPNTEEANVRKYIANNIDRLRYLAPSGSNPAHQSLINQLNQACHE